MIIYVVSKLLDNISHIFSFADEKMQDAKQIVLTSDGSSFATLLVDFDKSFLYDFANLQRYFWDSTEIGVIAEWSSKTHLKQTIDTRHIPSYLMN